MKSTKFLIITLIHFAILQTLHAQETFLKIYQSPEDKAIYSIIESDDNHLIFCGVIWTNPELTGSIGTMMKIGMDGEIINSTNYDFEYGNSQFSELINPITTTGSYYLSGSKDSIGIEGSYNTLFIHSIDNELNITETRHFGLWPDTVNDPWDFEILNDSIAYLLSFFETENSLLHHNYSLIKANLNNGEFDYIIPDDTISKAATSLYIDEVSELIKVNYRIFNLTMYPWNPVAKINSDLNNIEVVMPENEFFSQTFMTKKSDTAYFLSGNTIDLNTLQRNLGIAEYNLNDSLLRQIMIPGGVDTVTHPTAGKKNILLTSDYIWVMGWYNTTLSLPCSYFPTYIMLNKLNYNLELMEQFFYGGDGVYFPRDIIETSNHHIVVAGEFFDNLSSPSHCFFNPFVLKVNSEGLIVNTDDKDLPLAMEAIVLPNPGKNFLQVKLGVQHKTATFQLCDLNGRLVLTKDNVTDMQYIDTSALPNGVYPFRISAGNKVIGMGKWLKE